MLFAEIYTVWGQGVHPVQEKYNGKNRETVSHRNRTVSKTDEIIRRLKNYIFCILSRGPRVDIIPEYRFPDSDAGDIRYSECLCAFTEHGHDGGG